MGKIKVSSCETDGMVIEGLHVIEPTVFNDERGYFMETYNQNDFKEAIYWYSYRITSLCP